MRAGSLVAILFLLAGTASAQVPSVGVYTSELAINCNLVDDFTGVLSVYVVVDGTGYGVQAARFRARQPTCFQATWIGDESVFPVYVGNSQDGIAVSLPGCYPTPTHVLTIKYFVMGNTPACCNYPVEPAVDMVNIEVVDCNLDLLVAEGLNHTVNGNDTCFCGINPEPESPHNPDPADGGSGVSVLSGLSWESSDPLGDPLTYDVYFGKSPSPPLISSDQSESTYDPGILDYGAQYYWRVVVKDDKGNEVSGPVWSFSTWGASTSVVRVASALNYCGLVTDDTVRVGVDIVTALTDIRSGGFDVTYDPAVLTFAGCEPGSVTAGWQSLTCVVGGGTVRVDASDPVGLQAGESGRWVTLVFTSDCCAVTPAVTDLCVDSVSGDLRAQFPVCGTFTCSTFGPDGDLTGDGAVTPRDALCAMQAYLNFPQPPASGCAGDGWDIRGDVDCSADITPGDALCILHNWLDGSCAFCGGTKQAASVAQSSRLRVESVSRAGDVLRVVLSARVDKPLSAFGFDITFTQGSLELLAVEHGGLLSDFDNVADVVVSPGRARVGGYTTRPTSVLSGDLVVLRFRELRDDLVHGVTVDRGVDALAGMETVSETLGTPRGDAPGGDLLLYQNAPNPFNPQTEIRFRIPGSDGMVSVTLSIYDVGGRRVRELLNERRAPGMYRELWDGRDASGRLMASGVYFYVLRTGDSARQRKMVLIK